MTENEAFTQLLCEIAAKPECGWSTQDLLSFVSAHADHDYSNDSAHDLYHWCQIEDTDGLVKLMVALLSQERGPSQLTSQRTFSKDSNRYTDWAKSATYRSGNFQLRYYNKPKVVIPHQEVGRYLISMAERLRNLLNLFEPNLELLPNLEQAIVRARKHYNILESKTVAVPEGLRRKHILDQLSLSFQALDLSLLLLFENISTQLFDCNDKASRKFAEKLAEGLNAQNSNTLLEVIAVLSIVKAALSLPLPYEIKEGYPSQDGRLIGFELKREDEPKRLVIAKKKPSFCENSQTESKDTESKDTESKDTESKETQSKETQFKEIMQGMGDKATGLEPDICLEFYSAGEKNLSKTHLADAKRNASSHPEQYRSTGVKSAFNYLFSYKEFEDKLTNPPFTLFFLERGNLIAGRSPEEFRNSGFPHSPPKVIGLGFKEGDYEGQIIKKWLGGLIERVANKPTNRRR